MVKQNSKAFKDFEQKMERLEEITAVMQDGDVKIQDSVKLFEEGMSLINELESELNQIEEKVKILINGKEEIFDAEE